MTNMTTTDLWKALEQVLRDKGATDAWIEYALPDLQIAASQYASQAYGNGHDDARTGWPLPNPGDSPPLNIVTEADGSRWLELLPEKSLDEHIAESQMMMKAPLPAGMADTPEARERLQAAFSGPRCQYCNDQSPDECRYC